jgi:hypothetical protein
MKLTGISTATSVLALTLGISACTDGLTDINVNPNRPTDVPTSLIIRPAITGSAAFLGVALTWNHAGLWAQHYAQIQYTEEDRYIVRDGTVQAIWDAWYGGALQNIQTIIDKARETSRPNEEAVGLILKSWNFGSLTDMYGDAPYSEALRGSEGLFTPKYDTQQEIYNGVLADLKNAADMINPAAAGFGANDLIYQGNMARWRMFANSLRMRNAIHLTKVDAARARSEFEAAMGAPGGVFTSNADEARLNYLAASPNRNPFFENQLTRNDHRISATIVNHLKATNDPRLPIYANPIEADGVSYEGHENGQDHQSAPLTSRSKVGNWFTSATSPVFFMRYSEMLFIRAEAAQRGWSAGGTAKDLYEAAVRASMAQYGISDAAATAFLSQPGVNFDAAPDKLALIATQKWVALFGQGIEAFVEWRRTGHPQLTPGPLAALSQVPRRLPYPDLERSLNLANYNEAVSRQNDITLSGRVWWDRP